MIEHRQPQIRVTILDLVTGDEESLELADDYVLVCSGTCELTNTQVYPTKGTHILTVKGRKA